MPHNICINKNLESEMNAESQTKSSEVELEDLNFYHKPECLSSIFSQLLYMNFTWILFSISIMTPGMVYCHFLV